MSIGAKLGSVAGYYGHWTDSLIMRLTDAMLSMPALLLLIMLTRILGASVSTIILVIGLLTWMQVTRIVRANVLSLKAHNFVLAARAMGVTDRLIILRHVLPNTLAPVVAAATLGVGYAIILEASGCSHPRRAGTVVTRRGAPSVVADGCAGRSLTPA